jgi:hypothetical protein
MHYPMFEMRLAGGYRMFWSTITPTVCGRLQTTAAPAFCRDADFAGLCGEGTPGIWDLWPIDNPARPHPLEEADQMCRPVHLAAQTPRIALISVQPADSNRPAWLWLELFASATETGPDGRSALEAWAEILRAAKDDPSQDAIVRLDLGAVTPDEIAGFRSHKKLVTTDITLEVRPRPTAP